MRAWGCIISHPLRSLPYLAYDNVNPAMVISMMLHSSMPAFEKVYIAEHLRQLTRAQFIDTQCKYISRFHSSFSK